MVLQIWLNAALDLCIGRPYRTNQLQWFKWVVLNFNMHYVDLLSYPKPPKNKIKKKKLLCLINLCTPVLLLVSKWSIKLLHCGWLQLQSTHYHLLSLDKNPKKQKLPNRTGLQENCAFCRFFFLFLFGLLLFLLFGQGCSFNLKLGREINWTMVPLSCLEQRSWTIVPKLKT